jgi:hypothetical protein
MWTKTKIALSTLLAVGLASTAPAGETAKSKIGRHKPYLAQTVHQPAGTAAFGYAGSRRSLDRSQGTRDFSIRSQH